MKYLLLATLLYPLILLGQNEQVKKLLDLHYRQLKNHHYDSVIVTSQQIIELDPKIAKENYIDFYMAYAAFESKQYDFAVKQAKKFIPLIHIKARKRKRALRNDRYQALCFQLANYYEQTENYRKAYHNLSLIDRKYDRVNCCTCRHSWQTSLYNRMINCSNKLGKTGRVKRLEKKLEKFNNK